MTSQSWRTSAPRSAEGSSLGLSVAVGGDFSVVWTRWDMFCWVGREGGSVGRELELGRDEDGGTHLRYLVL